MPTLIDFIATDPDEQLVTSLLTVLNRYFQLHYVPPSAPAAERKSKLFNLVRKRDRPSILAWLANASVKQRRLCGRMMQRMQVAHEDAPVTAGRQAFHNGGKLMDAIIHQDLSMAQELSGKPSSQPNGAPNARGSLLHNFKHSSFEDEELVKVGQDSEDCQRSCVQPAR